MPPPITTACPTCKKAVAIPGDDEPMGAFPFCSERCKVIDLGRWLDGKYQIPVAPDEDESPFSMPGDGAMD